MKQIEIRTATDSDVEHVLPLVEEFVASFELDPDQYRASYARLLENPDAAIFVAQSGDTVIGYCLGFAHDTFYANGPVAWLEEITVAQGERRSGLGGTLMAAFEDWARSKNAVLCALATRRAASFYLAIGYEESAAYFRKVL